MPGVVTWKWKSLGRMATMLSCEAIAKPNLHAAFFKFPMAITLFTKYHCAKRRSPMLFLVKVDASKLLLNPSWGAEGGKVRFKTTGRGDL